MPHNQELLDGFLAKIRKRIKDLGLPSRHDETLEFGGYFTSNFYNKHLNKNEKNLAIRINKTDAFPPTPKTLTLSIALPKNQQEYAQLYQAEAESFLENEYGLINRNKDLSDTDLERIIITKIRGINHEEPEAFPEDNEHGVRFSGIYNTRRTYSSSRSESDSVTMTISLRNKGDIGLRRTEYIKDPFIVHFTTSVANADDFEAKLKRVLNRLGLSEHNLSKSTKLHTDKTIPKEWVAPDRVRLSSTNTGVYQIVVVSDRQRLPNICCSTSHSDAQCANRILEAVRDELLPQYLSPTGTHKNDPLTLGVIRQYIERNFPAPIVASRPPTRTDQRMIQCGNHPKVKLGTPGIKFKRHGYDCELKFIPPASSKNMGRELVIPLNTHDENYANQLARQLQTITECTLEKYFRDHPMIEIVTEHARQRGGKVSDRTEPIFKIPQLDEMAPANHVFLRQLIDEEIRPALADLNRYIMWNVTIEEDVETQEHLIRCEVRRNQMKELLPEGTSPFQGPFVLRTRSLEAAQAFTSDLRDEIIRQQCLFSNDRPVEAFGARSTSVVIRESLGTTLDSHKDVIPPNSALFTTLIGRRV